MHASQHTTPLPRNDRSTYHRAADIQDFDASTGATFGDREYFHGWSNGDHVVLLYADERGRRGKEIVPFEWYFFIDDAQKRTVDDPKWAWLIGRGWVKRIARDPLHDDYWRIYVENPHRLFSRKRVFDKRHDPNFRGNWVLDWVVGERPAPLRWPRDRARWTDLHHVLHWLECRGIEPLEADLTLKQRFLTDFDIRIQSDYRTCYLDIETDDTAGGFDNKEDNRILSIAWEGNNVDSDPSDAGFLVLEEDSDAAEKNLLRRFREAIRRYHVLAAWNGVGFDFPVILWRCEQHGFRVDWREWLFVDPLPVFRRHYVRAAGDVTSFALDSIGNKVLGISKVDWRPEFRRRHPGVTPTFRNLWQHDRSLLEEYNRNDCRILRLLEEFTGFVFIEQTFCRIANGFANDFQISTKVDQLLLKKGLKDGQHFRTRYFTDEERDRYYGAFVFEPKIGMHRNVGAFDFKSLYPSMVRAFNISPETLVKRGDRGRFAEKDLCFIPVVEVEDDDGRTRRRGGSSFRIDREGYISQMFVRTLERRKKYTDLQKERLDEVGTTQDDLYLLYYRLAYSFKRLGLSFYGDMGNPRSRFYDTELAESITLAGQFFIKLTAQFARENGFEPLYGDTDSVYIRLAPDDKTWPDERARIADLNAIGQRFVAYCQERYLEVLRQHSCNLDWNVIELEFEDIYDQIFFVKKKRYAGRMLSKKGSATDDIEVKGLEVMRSDVSEAARALQRRVLDAILMRRTSAAEIEAEIVRPELERCASGNLSVDEVAIGKGVSKDPSEYETRALHIRLADEIKQHGREFFVGMKVEYVVTDSSGPRLQGMIRQDFEEHGAVYDPEYYWDRVIFPATLRILEVVHPERPWRRLLVSHRRRRRKLVERYKRWFLDRRKVVKAIQQIRANARGLLGESEIDELRLAPRYRLLAGSEPQFQPPGSRPDTCG